MNREADLQFAMQGIGRHCHELCNCTESEKKTYKTYIDMYKTIANGIYSEVPLHILDHHLQIKAIADRRKRMY